MKIHIVKEKFTKINNGEKMRIMLENARLEVQIYWKGVNNELKVRLGN